MDDLPALIDSLVQHAHVTAHQVLLVPKLQDVSFVVTLGVAAFTLAHGVLVLGLVRHRRLNLKRLGLGKE